MSCPKNLHRKVEMTTDHPKVNWTAIGVMVALLVQLSALVWGAATLSGGLASLELTVGKLEAVGNNLANNLSDVTTRLRLLEYRLDQVGKELERVRR